MAVQVLDILPPVGGLNRAVGFQSESPYFYSDGLNYWSRDVFEQRERGGSRPGLLKAFPAGVTGPVHLLANVRVVEGSGSGSNQVSIDETFSAGALGSQWSKASWLTALVSPEADGSKGYAALRPETAAVISGGQVLRNLEADLTAVFKISMEIHEAVYTLNSPGVFVQSASIHPTTVDAVYSLFARMDNTNPNVTAKGILVELSYVGTQQGSIFIYEYVAGVRATLGQFAIGPVSNVYPITLKLEITDATNSCKVILRQTGLEDQTLTVTATGPTGSPQRCGFGISGHRYEGFAFPIASNTRIRVDNFRVEFTSDIPVPNRNYVVAAGGTDADTQTAGGPPLPVGIYARWDNTLGEFSKPNVMLVANPNARHLQAAELLGRLYVVGEDANSVLCFDARGSGIFDTIAGVHSAGGSFAFTPAPSGSPPSACSIIAAWRNRLVVSGQRGTGAEPHNVFMSKAGEPQNWNYAALPVGSAVKLNTTGIDSGQVGEPITCLIAHSDDYLVIGCLNSLYVLRGDPTYGGQIDRLSSSIGIAAPQAWARGPNGETVILSNDGLYGIPPQIGGFPESISREVLPQELRDIDVNNYRVLMAYDVRNRGVFIGITAALGSGGTYWWFDWQKRGFHPMTFNAAHEPTALVYRNADSPLDQRLLFGCRDGHIRAMNDNAFDDDGVAFKPKVLIGPIALGSTGYEEGMIREVIGELAEGSSPVDGEVWAGRSIENARKNPRKFPFTLRAGKNRTFNPQLSGNACYIQLSGAPPWSMEKLCIVRERLGKQLL